MYFFNQSIFMIVCYKTSTSCFRRRQTSLWMGLDHLFLQRPGLSLLLPIQWCLVVLQIQLKFNLLLFKGCWCPHCIGGTQQQETSLKGWRPKIFTTNLLIHNLKNYIFIDLLILLFWRRIPIAFKISNKFFL